LATASSGVETIGKRVTRIFNPGTFGNDNQVTVVREFWYSQQLGINLHFPRWMILASAGKLSPPRISRLASLIPSYLSCPRAFAPKDRRSHPDQRLPRSFGQQGVEVIKSLTEVTR
jgi:hypothetical protein